MDRYRTQYGGSSMSSTNRSSTYSRSRPLPIVTNTSVSSITKSIQSGNMNVSTGTIIRPRPTSRLRQTLPERSIRSIPIITQRTRLVSQDRSNITSNRTTIPNYLDRRTSNERLSNYADRRASNATVTVYSIEAFPQATDVIDDESTVSKASRPDHASLTTDESKLINGGLTGLQNLGNTCFMNSVLQCLSNTKPLLLFCLKKDLEYYLNTSTTSVMRGVLMKEYANLVRKMWLLPEGRTIVSPSSFKNTIGKFAPRFTGYSEQDSQEFLRYLLQGLHEDVNRIQRKPLPITVDDKEEERMREKDRAKLSWDRCLRYDNSPLVDIFAGQLKSTLECSYCQYQSITFDMFWDLSIPLPRSKSSTSLQECLQLFMSKEELDGNEKPMCAKCKQKRTCTKKFSIQKCPDILVLHLKRFSQMRGRSKLDTYVDFPLTNLKLSDLADVISESHEGSVPTYNLFGISNHSGTLYSGHYIAQCKHPYTNQWHEFNDSNVHSIIDNSRIISANAYVLFYERNKH